MECKQKEIQIDTGMVIDIKIGRRKEKEVKN